MNKPKKSYFDQIVGHNATKNMLKESLRRDQLASFYLISGPEHIGKSMMAWAFAQSVVCHKTSKGLACQVCRSCKLIVGQKHPDIKTVESTDSIGIKEVDKIKKAMSSTPSMGERQVAIIDAAENLTKEAANSLLKTLEEPKASQLFMLVTSAPEKLLSTIKSRSQHLKMALVEPEKIAGGLQVVGADSVLAEKLAQLSEGRPGKAFTFLDKPKLLARQKEQLKNLWDLASQDINQRFVWADKVTTNRKEQLVKVLNVWLSWFREILLIKTGAHKFLKYRKFSAKAQEFSRKYSLRQLLAIIKNIMEIQKNLEVHANPRLALETLLLSI